MPARTHACHGAPQAPGWITHAWMNLTRIKAGVTTASAGVINLSILPMKESRSHSLVSVLSFTHQFGNTNHREERLVTRPVQGFLAVDFE